MANRIEKTFTLSPDLSAQVADFLELGSLWKAKKEILISARVGPQVFQSNRMQWDSKKNTLALGPHWQDWSTGTTNQKEGPQYTFTINFAETQKSDEKMWKQWLSKLKKNSDIKFRDYFLPEAQVVGGVKFSSAADDSTVFAIVLWQLKSIDPAQYKNYGADAEGYVISLSAGEWKKRTEFQNSAGRSFASKKIPLKVDPKKPTVFFPDLIVKNFGFSHKDSDEPNDAYVLEFDIENGKGKKEHFYGSGQESVNKSHEVIFENYKIVIDKIQPNVSAEFEVLELLEGQGINEKLIKTR